MVLYPAIDILDGHAVRLTRGDFAASKAYDADPLDAARRWVGEGAQYLHLVDLDGARAGMPVNLEHVRRIASELGVPVQLGGGLRSAQAIADALGAGAARVILGTAAFSEDGFLEHAIATHGPERVMVSVDVKDGRVMVDGWREAAPVSIREVFAHLVDRGARALLYTNIDRDGTLDGLPPAALEAIEWVSLAAAQPRNVSADVGLIYSGGIGSLQDLEAIAQSRATGHLGVLDGVIVGKALYEQRFTVAQALAALAR